MGWNTNTMIRRPPNAMDQQQRRTIQQLSGVMGQAGTPIQSAGSANLGYNSPVQAPNTFGSNIRMPPASASSQAIAGFANIPPAQAAQTPTIPQTPVAPVAPQPMDGAARTPLQREADWWGAINANAQPSGSIAPTQAPDHASYVKQMNDIQDYARSQGMAQPDIDAFGQRLNYVGANTYGGGDPARAYAQWQAEQAKVAEIAQAQAAAGSDRWLARNPG